MPTRNVPEADEKARLEELREAARVGIDDIAAGRFRSFHSRTVLARHVHWLAEKAIAAEKLTTPPA